MGAPGWDGNHPQSNRLRWVVVGSGMPDRNWTIGNAEYEFNELTLDNNSYRASIGSVGVRPNGPKIRATPLLLRGLFRPVRPFPFARPPHRFVGVSETPSCPESKPSRCLRVLPWLTTIASAHGSSIHTSQRSDRTVHVRRQIQCRAMAVLPCSTVFILPGVCALLGRVCVPSP